MTKPKWDIRNEGRAWGKDEAWPRFVLRPEKIEMVEGKVLSTELSLQLLSRLTPHDRPPSLRSTCDAGCSRGVDLRRLRFTRAEALFAWPWY